MISAVVGSRCSLEEIVRQITSFTSSRKNTGTCNLRDAVWSISGGPNLAVLGDQLLETFKIWTHSNKQQKILAKGLRALIEAGVSEVPRALTEAVETWLAYGLSGDSLSKLLFLLDEFEDCREQFQRSAHCTQQLVNVLHDYLKTDVLLVDQCHTLQQILRLVVVVSQKTPDVLLRAKEKNDAFEPLLKILTVVTFNTAKYTQEVSSLAATAMALALKVTARSASRFMTSFLYVYHSRDGQFGCLQQMDMQEELLLTLPLSSLLLPVQYCFGHIALINSLLNVNMADVLVHGEVMLLSILNAVVAAVQAKVNDYHAFQLLLLWYTEVVQAINKGSVLPASAVLTVSAATMELIWSHCDSPVEGVPDFVVDTFALLMQVQDAIGRADDFALDICHKCSNIPWTVKGKYRLFVVLVRYVNINEMLSQNPDLVDSVASHFAVNYLASTCGRLLTSLVTSLVASPHCLPPSDGSGATASVAAWRRWCLQPLLRCLLSSSALVRQHSVQHWLTGTLRCLPTAADILLDELLDLPPSERLRCLGAQLSVLRVVRALGMQPKFDTSLHNRLLRAAVTGVCWEVRSSALALLCVSPKKTEVLTDLDISLLKWAVVHNMAVDSSPFRQQLVHSLSALLCRARDSVLAALKKNQKAVVVCDVPYATAVFGFLDWLFELAMCSLFPGASYQRKVTALSIVELFYSHLSSLDPSSSAVLLNHAKRLGLLDIYGNQHFERLLSVLMDSTNEVRERAAKLLQKLSFSSPCAAATSSGYTKPEHSSRGFLHLLPGARGLIRSFKTDEAESGALLCRLLLHKLIELERSGEAVNLPAVSTAGLAQVLSSSLSIAQHFVLLLMSDLKIAFTDAQSNLCNASIVSSASGILCAIQQCLVHTSAVDSGNGETWTRILTDLCATCQSLVQFVLDILSSKSEARETAPSFADMGVALDSIADCKESIGDDFSHSSSEVQQRILSWCWHVLQHSCGLGGDMAQLCNSNPGLVPSPVLHAFAEMYVQTLTRCRHKGAVEGCSVGFVRFCTALFASKDTTVRSIPSKILEQALGCLNDDYCYSSSVTRRSAGLPNLVNCVLASEQKVKMGLLLHSSMERLLEVFSRPVVVEADMRVDLPQVHAANMLCACIQESTLSEGVRRHLELATQLTLDAFSSPSWAIRNAALQLYATIAVRLLGQGRMASDCGSSSGGGATITSVELFAYYPALRDYFGRCLVQAAADQEQSEAESGPSIMQQLHPAAFAVLSLLARLTPSTMAEHAKSLHHGYREAVLALAASPAWAVRDLASRAYVATMHSQQEMLEAAKTLAWILPSSDAPMAERMGTNRLHGTLLFVEKLLHAIHSAPQPLNVRAVYETLLQKRWLIGSENRCCFTKAKYLSILGGAHPLPISLLAAVKAIMTEKLDVKGGIGRDCLSKEAFYLYISSLEASVAASEILHLLRLHAADEHLHIIVQLLQDRPSLCRCSSVLQAALLSLVTTSTVYEVVDGCTRLLLTIFQMDADGNAASLLQREPSAYSTAMDAVRLRSASNESSIGALNLQLYAFMLVPIASSARTGGSQDKMEAATAMAAELYCLLLDACQSTRAEHWRRHAAVALRPLFNLSYRSEKVNLNCTPALSCTGDCSRLLLAALTLLDDEDSSIREDAAVAVSEGLAWHQDVQGNFCAPSLLKEILVQMLCERLSTGASRIEDLYSAFFCSQKANVDFLMHEGATFLFEKEECNVYVEKPLVMYARVQAMEHAIGGSRIRFSHDWLCKELKAVVSNLSSLKGGLVSASQQRQEVLPQCCRNMWLKPAVAELVTSLICRARLLCRLVADSPTYDSRVLDVHLEDILKLAEQLGICRVSDLKCCLIANTHCMVHTAQD